MPSPPWEPVDNPTPGFPPVESTNNASVTSFPALEPQVVPQSRPGPLETLRANSDHSLNPVRELTDRSRAFEDVMRPHAQSDPITASTAGGLSEADRTE